MTGKKDRPRTEPMYSGGKWEDYPITSGYDSVGYVNFITSHIKNSQRIVITQSLHNGRFSGCFATSKLYSPRPSIAWSIVPDDDAFLEYVKKKGKRAKEKSYMIYSLACDEELGFGVVLMQKFGAAQTILTGTSDIKKKSDEGFRITACAAMGSSFFIIMTKGTKEYTGKVQEWFAHGTWKEIASGLDRGYKEGKGITGICYSTGLEPQYFVVMTEMAERQRYEWFENTDGGNVARRDWVDQKYKEGFYVTIIFIDPTDNKILIVTTQGNNLSECLCQVSLPLNNAMLE